MIPSSYILYNDDEIKKFKIEYDPNKIYILKKNIQRQEGLKITKDFNEILEATNNGYIIVQELLQNPYIIANRKTNMRFYVLVVCKNNNMKIYVYNDGFMYYSKSLFQKNNLNMDVNITTGYIDRQIYVDNPLTHQDLIKYLDNPNRTNLSITEQNIKNQKFLISTIYFDRIHLLLKKIFIAFYNKLSTTTKFNETNTMFQLFGIDIAVDDQLNPTIMEVNKGPDLGAKDERDKKLKHNVIFDLFNLINNVSESPNFIKILDMTNGNIN
jgi:hypothetical protein